LQPNTKLVFFFGLIITVLFQIAPKMMSPFEVCLLPKGLNALIVICSLNNNSFVFLRVVVKELKQLDAVKTTEAFHRVLATLQVTRGTLHDDGKPLNRDSMNVKDE